MPAAFLGDAWSELRAQARALLLSEVDRSGTLIFKDQRLCRLLPFWLPVLDEMDARFLFVVRNPLEIAASLRLRNGMDARQAERLWMAHVFEGLMAMECRQIAAISFDALVSDCRASISAVAPGLGIAPESVAAAAPKLESEFDPALRHHRFSAEDVARTGELSSLARQLYLDVLLAATCGPLPAALLSQLHAQWIRIDDTAPSN